MKRVVVEDNKVYIADEEWITLNGGEGNGNHVLLGEGGVIIAGAGGALNGIKLTRARGGFGSRAGQSATKSVEPAKQTEPAKPAEPEKPANTQSGEVISDRDAKRYQKVLETGKNGHLYKHLATNVEYNPIRFHEKQPTEDEVIKTIGGVDTTEGSCFSLSMAFCGQTNGMNIKDYRGGRSRAWFSKMGQTAFEEKCSKAIAGKVRFRDGASGAMSLLNSVVKNAPLGKTFMLLCGEHAAIVRNSSKGFQYLELQNSSSNNGWKNIAGKDTIKNRFNSGFDSKSFKPPATLLFDCEKLSQTKFFQYSAGYINTAKKGRAK